MLQRLKTGKIYVPSSASTPDYETFAIENLLNLVHQAILLVGQTNNIISYHKWLSAPAGALKNSSRANPMIKDESMSLENSGKELFGNDFHHQITDTVKARKKSKELLFNVF